VTARIIDLGERRRVVAPRSGAFVVRTEPDQVCVALPGRQFVASHAEARFAGALILEALAAGITLSQIKDMAMALQGEDR